MNAKNLALGREAELAAEHLAIGITALGKANYAEHAYYGQAFFALTIGLERAAKLALLVDHAIQNRGAFPSTKELRNYGHNLKELLERADQIALRIVPSDPNGRLPKSTIHGGIIGTLTEFATNITRYYNLDFVTGGARVTREDDPIRRWFVAVTVPILADHYKPRHRQRHHQNAEVLDQLFAGHANILHSAEIGSEIDTVYEGSMQYAITQFAAPYCRMYIMQIARFIALLLDDLGYRAQQRQLADIPSFGGSFAIYNNSDQSFKTRKTWSIYR